MAEEAERFLISRRHRGANEASAPEGRLAALHVLSLLAREMELFAGDAADAWAPAWPRMLAAIRSKRKKVRVLAAETLGLCLAGLHARAPRADYSTLLRLARGCFTELLFGGGARGAALPAAEVIIAIAEAGTGAILKDLHELLLRLEERSNPATDTTHYGNSRISATSFYQHYARHIGAAVQDAFGVEMLRVEACLGQAWLKRQRVLRDPGLIDDPRPPPKRREPSA